MSTAASRDIAPEFKSILSKLPLSALQDMEICFTEGLSKKLHITPADKKILKSFQEERTSRQHITAFILETKKCLCCNTYHDQDKQHCPECGRYLYSCGDIYQPKVRKKVQG